MAELLKKLFPIDLQLFAEGDDSQDDDSTGGGDNQENDQKNQKGDDQQTFDAEYVQKLRKEAAKYRTDKNKAEQRLKAIQKALGLDDDPDPDELKKQLTERDQRIRTLAIENAFGKVASKLGADPDLTLAVLHRRGVLDTLDVDDSSFAETLEAEVKKLLDANPKLKATDTQKSGDGGTDKTPDPKLSINDLIRRAAGRK
ncbi:MAG TPA: hypothetical protein PK822_08715 [Bacillota bacterium]|nr:hypothetical protein [Bacillota bacterium]